MNLRPPSVLEKFEDNDALTQSKIIAYSQIREYEDSEAAGANFSKKKS